MIFMYMSCLVYDKPSSDSLNLSQELREELQRLKDQNTPNHQVGDLDFIAKFLVLTKTEILLNDTDPW